jgi:NhaP-type Na+/H+ or K+/H+ antiporter
VFGVIVLQEHLPGEDTIVMTVVFTIILSVIGHGLSANPMAKALAARERARTGTADSEDPETNES